MAPVDAQGGLRFGGRGGRNSAGQCSREGAGMRRLRRRHAPATHAACPDPAQPPCTRPYHWGGLDRRPGPAGGPSHKQQHVLARDTVRFVGEEVAALAADTPEIADAALDLIQISYEPLPALLDPADALTTGAPLVHAGSNLADEINIQRGDIDAGFAPADLIPEENHRTHSQYPGYMEPMATVAATDANGRLTVWTSTQSVFLARQRLAEALDRPVSSIRVIQATVGGGFGGKIVEERSSVIAAFLATRTDRPVRLGLTRIEDMLSGCLSVPETIRLRLGMRRDGTITAKEVEILADCGAFAGLAPDILIVSAMRCM